jgi:hypothetical protein
MDGGILANDNTEFSVRTLRKPATQDGRPLRRFRRRYKVEKSGEADVRTLLKKDFGFRRVSGG